MLQNIQSSIISEFFRVRWIMLQQPQTVHFWLS